MTAPPTTHSPRTHRARGISRLEIGAAGIYVVVLLVLVAIEPDILQAPFESTRSPIIVTFGGAVLAVVALTAMIRLGGSPPVVRVLVIGIPTVVPCRGGCSSRSSSTTWSTRSSRRRSWPSSGSLRLPVQRARCRGDAERRSSPPRRRRQRRRSSSGTERSSASRGTTALVTQESSDSRTARSCCGSRTSTSTTGPTSSCTSFPGRSRTHPETRSLHLGALEGQRGEPDLRDPRNFEVSPGPWTVLVWCKAFTVEFVGVLLTVAYASIASRPWEPPMTVDVTHRDVIDRPVDVVAAYAADPSNAPEWYANIDSVAWKTEPPVAVGSRCLRGPVPRPAARVHLRGGRAGTGRAARDADRGGAVPDGDDLHVGAAGERRRG